MREGACQRVLSLLCQHVLLLCFRQVVDARAGPGTKSMNKIKSKAAALVAKDPLKEER